MNYIIRRTITTTNPNTIDYYNGKSKSIWSYKKDKAKIYNDSANAYIDKIYIENTTFETYPLSIIKHI